MLIPLFLSVLALLNRGRPPQWPLRTHVFYRPNPALARIDQLSTILSRQWIVDIAAGEGWQGIENR
jgi:hypothetical protein